MSDAVPISIEQLPSVVRDGFAREHRGKGNHEGAVGVKIEYSKKRNVYRFTLPDGTMIHLNANGEWSGTVI